MFLACTHTCKHKQKTKHICIRRHKWEQKCLCTKTHIDRDTPTVLQALFVQTEVCWSSAADLLFSVCASVFFFSFFYCGLKQQLSHACRSFLASVSSFPSLSLIIYCHSASVLFCSRSPFVILSTFWPVLLTKMACKKERKKERASFSHSITCQSLLSPASSLPSCHSHLSFPALSTTGRSCQSFFTPAASVGGGEWGRLSAGREQELALTSASDWLREHRVKWNQIHSASLQSTAVYK